MLGGTVFYAAAKVEGGYPRADGKRFYMSYVPSNILPSGNTRRVI